MGRWWRASSGCLLAGLLLQIQLGPTPTSRAVDQINRASRQPLPSVAPRPVPPADMVWVPDRYVPIPGEPGGVLVPGHWERRIGEREYHVPPVTVIKPSDGTLETIPGGVRPPVEERRGP
jgi:hypothetical protein